jgi:hypothetical protein
MSDLWYRSCRGVKHGAHRLELIGVKRVFRRERLLLLCLEKGCDLQIEEPSFRKIRLSLRYERIKREWQYGFIGSVIKAILLVAVIVLATWTFCWLVSEVYRA